MRQYNVLEYMSYQISEMIHGILSVLLFMISGYCPLPKSINLDIGLQDFSAAPLCLF